MSEKEETLKLDFSGLTDVLKQHDETLIKQVSEALKPKEQAEGKGYVTPPEQSRKLIEALKSAPGSGTNWKLAEQWTVVIPNYRQKELAAGLRDYIYFWDGLMNEPGDVANIPYVSDVDFEQLGAVGNAIAATWAEASLMSSLTTTLYETAGYADLSYYLIERFDQNLLEEINRMLANAAVRSEDAKIMALVEAVTATSFAGQVRFKDEYASTGTLSTNSTYFYAANIPKALAKLLATGKNVKPQECVLYLTPNAYNALLQELIASQVFAFATPEMITSGIVESMLGVKVVVGGYKPSQQRSNANTGTVDLCFLMRGKRAIALAPKRELLVETQKQIGQRKLRVTASHTFGVKIIDAKEIVRIWTSIAHT